MPSVCTKFKVSEVHDFDKYISREQGARSERGGNYSSAGGGLNGSKNKYLQDYDYDFMVNKPKITKGCKYTENYT